MGSSQIRRASGSPPISSTHAAIYQALRNNIARLPQLHRKPYPKPPANANAGSEVRHDEFDVRIAVRRPHVAVAA
jgi:hypothetical protein